MRRLTIPIALLAVVAAAAAAAAKLPSKQTIVPGKAVGGVTIGLDAQKAVDAWGKGGSCDTAVGATCAWDGPNGSQVRFDVTAGKVSLITIEAGQRANGTPVYKGTITKWQTSKGIGIGSTLREVLKAYPKAAGSASGVDLVVGKKRTTFNSSLGRVSRIEIFRDP